VNRIVDGDVEQDTRIEQNIGATAQDLTVVFQQVADVTAPRDPGPPPQRAPSPQIVVGDIPRAPPGFQPRPDLLARLDQSETGTSVIHPVTGNRGLGCTQLAAAYARAKLAAEWRFVVWVNAADMGSLMAGLAAAADVPGFSAGGSWRDTADAGRALRHRLEADGDRCLLVFDDAEDPDELRPFVPANGAARILIVGTRPSTTDLGTSVPVDVFSADEAVAFLTRRTGLEDEAGAAAVAAKLEHQPLALALAAAVIAWQDLGYATYLEWLRAVSTPVSPIHEEEPPIPHGIVEAVLLSLEAIRAADRTGLCTRVMEMMAVMSASGIRRELLAAGRGGELVIGGHRVTAALADRVLAQLAERSLLTFSLDGRRVVAHRLVTQVVRDEMAWQKRLTTVGRAAASVLEARAQSLDASQERLAVRDISQQVTALVENTAPSLGEADAELTKALLRLRFLVLYHLIELGDSATQAVTLGEPLTGDLHRALGPDHPDTLNSRNSLAAAYQAAGRADDAIRLFQQTLVSRVRLLGPGHPDTQTSQNNLAAAYQDAGRVAEAILLFELTLAARERLLGVGHPSTLNSQGNLAAAYRDAGQTDDAISLLEQTLSGRERLLGTDHPDTLSSRNSLANAYRDAGRAAEAVSLMEQTVAVRERLLGADHAKTLASRNNLAAAYRDAGRIDDAVPLFERTLAARERLLGDDHPSTLNSRNNLANAYRDAGRAPEAVPLAEQVLSACERLLGASDAKTLASRANLAAAYRDAGRVGEAIALMEETLAARERLLGADHRSTLTSRCSLATAYLKAGRADEAIPLFGQTLTARERLLGADHPDTLATRDSLACACQEAGRVIEAILEFEQALAARERLLGADHPDTLATRTSLALAYEIAGQPEQAGQGRGRRRVNGVSGSGPVRSPRQ
jgi:tetratricopeptide (TPR) repeat protein